MSDEFLESRREFEGDSPLEVHGELMEKTHRIVDQVFSTNQAFEYTAEYRNRERLTSAPEVKIGILPIPGLFGGALKNVSPLVRIAEREAIAASQATSVCGWKAGQDIRNRTNYGNVPKWSTVRQRYWKNKAELAKSNPNPYGEHNISRMKKGLAPQRVNKETGKLESMELYHNPAQRDGGLFDVVEVWADEHAALDKCRHTGWGN